MLLDPRAGSLRLRQRRKHQTHRHAPKHSKDDPHLNGEYTNKTPLANTLADVAHPIDETGGGGAEVFTQARSGRRHRRQVEPARPSLSPPGASNRSLIAFAGRMDRAQCDLGTKTWNIVVRGGRWPRKIFEDLV
jgi:hypothetical protein